MVFPVKRFLMVGAIVGALALSLAGCTLFGFLDSISVQVNGTSVSTYSFGNQALYSTSQPVTVTIVNNGLFPLTFGGSAAIALNGNALSDFTLGGSPSDTIAAGGSATFTVTFAPSAMGARDAGITITPSGGSGSTSFSLTGTGAGSGTLALIYLDSGSVSLPVSDGGSTATDSFNTNTLNDIVFTITNTGSGSLYLSGTSAVSITSDPYLTVTAQPAQSIAAGNTTTFTLTYDTTSFGYSLDTRSVTVTIMSSDGVASTFTFTLNVKSQSG
jgi:trimeric autotransporter adhesin